MTFSVVGNDGSVPVRDPRLAAYEYMARLQLQNRRTSTLYDMDGSVTVSSPGLLTLKFVKES